jgi:nitrous oxidase accessory protein NosD
MDLPPEAVMTECTARIEAGQPLAAALAAGGVICLGPGVHAGPVVVTRSLTLRGEAGAVLDAHGGGSVVRVEVDDVVVRIESLTLRGGASDSGGGVSLTGYSEIVVAGCTLEGNRARALRDAGGGGGGGGAYANRGTLRVEDSTFRGNRGYAGSDLYLTGVADVTVRGGHLSGDVSVREGATVVLDGVSVTGVLEARGTTTRAPVVRVRGGKLAGGVQNDPTLPATVEIAP